MAETEKHLEPQSAPKPAGGKQVELLGGVQDDFPPEDRTLPPEKRRYRTLGDMGRNVTW